MTVEYPYMISNNKIQPIIESVISAAKPEKFTHNFLKNLGYASSNDRAVIPLFKKLGFLFDDGKPTEDYDRLRNRTKTYIVLGEKLKELYSELFMINQQIYELTDEEIKGAFSRITGKDAKTVDRYAATFKVLASLADFKSSPDKKAVTPKQPTNESVKPVQIVNPNETNIPPSQFHYNIQIHLPATTDISVYNAIFKSLKDNLIIY